MSDLNDTIVALSSASGAGARAIVRLSGPQVLNVVRSVFHCSAEIARQRAHWSGELRLSALSNPVPADLYLWIAPHSYTGQDLAELHLISSPPLVDHLIAELMHHGARAAQPGELTMRGFLAGKLDLTRAEAVHAVIEADSQHELTQALTQLAGGMSQPLQELRDDLLNLLADVEAGLDFIDEDIDFVQQEELLLRISKAMAMITLLGKQMDQRTISDRAFRVVLMGRPNAGKSSLFNALGEGNALVSDEAGTTRDYLLQRLEIQGMSIELIDTAGLRATNGNLEKEAQALGREQAEQADLMLLCVDASEAMTAEENEQLTQKDPPLLLVNTKCDQASGKVGGMDTSATTRLGLEQLREAIVEQARALICPALAPSLSRCRHHVTACLDGLRRAHAVVLYEDPTEMLALELRGALDHLGEMVGAVYTDDLLDRIFSRFCIGK